VYFVCIYENRRMKLFEIVLRRGVRAKRENNEDGKTNLYCKPTR
jgi:hypothetical protein